eukprot:14309383-Alexandrium_andersonii.AAC.1
MARVKFPMPATPSMLCATSSGLRRQTSKVMAISMSITSATLNPARLYSGNASRKRPVMKSDPLGIANHRGGPARRAAGAYGTRRGACRR